MLSPRYALMKLLPPAFVALLVLATACAKTGSTRQGSSLNAVDADPTDLQLYPVPTDDQQPPSSADIKLQIENTSVYVDHWQDSFTARFAISGPVSAAISIVNPITAYHLIPGRAFSHASVVGNTLTVTLNGPSNAVVELNDGQRLFLFADAFEVNPPTAGEPDVLSISDYGVDSSGQQIATTKLQRALDDAGALASAFTASSLGGATLLLPAGTYLSGTIAIPSHVTLYLAPGATLKGSPNLADYPVDPGRKENGSDATITNLDKRFLGQFMTFSRLILVDHATDVHIKGRGTIDANGTILRNQQNGVPNIVRVRQSANVSLEDLLLRDSAAWTVHFLKSHDTDVENLRIINNRTMISNDGINPDSSQNVTINNTFVYTNDDAVSLKGSNNSDLLADVSNVTVTNSIMSSSSGGALKLGTESQSTNFSQIAFQNDDVFASDRAMSLVVRDGANYQDVSYKTIGVHDNVTHLFEQVIGVRDGNKVNLGTINNLVFDGIDAERFVKPASNWTWYSQFRPDHPTSGSTAVKVFEGADAAHAVAGLTLKNLTINGTPVETADAALQLGNISFGDFISGLTVN